MPSRIDNIFKRFDTSITDYTSVKKADEEGERGESGQDVRDQL